MHGVVADSVVYSFVLLWGFGRTPIGLCSYLCRIKVWWVRLTKRFDSEMLRRLENEVCSDVRQAVHLSGVGCAGGRHTLGVGSKLL